MFLGYWGVGRDVTAEKQAEFARAATEARYRELFTRSPSPLVLHRDTRVVDANTAALSLFGVADTAVLIGRDLLDFYDEGDGSRARAAERALALRRLPAGQSMPAHQFVLRAANGRRIVAQVTSVKVDTGGGPAILSIYQDETELLQAEVSRARSEALMTHLVATSPDLITLTDLATGRYVMVNDAFVRVSGWRRDEAVGKTALELGVWPDAEASERFVREVGEQGEVRDRAVEFTDRQGRGFSLLVSAACFTLEGRDYLVLNGRDVTVIERERLEREAILQNASIGIAMTRDRVFQLANPKFAQMFGWDGHSLVGQPGAVVWPSDEAYAALSSEVGAALARGDPIDVERVMARRDGSTFVCRLLARAVDPTHPSKGATIWIADDVTERRAVEQALAQARDDAEAANRAKSAFLANTSHEIRTPLNGLVGLARLARQPGLDEARRERYLQQIDDSAQALSGVISDILDLSKIEAGKLRLEATDFDLHALLESIEHGYAALAEARALVLSMSVDAAVPRRVRGDPVRVRQVLSNYLSNALKFTEHGGVRIEVRRARRDAVALRGPGQRPGHRPGGAGAAVHALHAGRRVDHPALRRHRAGPVDLPRACAADGRRSRGGQRARSWQPLLGRPAAAGQRRSRPASPVRRGAARPAQRARRPARADGRRQPGQHVDRRGAARAMGRRGRAGQQWCAGPCRGRCAGRRRQAVRPGADGRADAGAGRL